MEENSTNTTTETKQNWFKSHLAVCIISAVVVIAAIVAIVLLLGNKGGKSPEEVLNTYVEAMKEGNADKLMSVTDIKGACAWEKCSKNASKFEEEYNKISDDDAKSYESTIKSTLEKAMGFLKSFGGVEISVNKTEKPEEIAKNLYKIKASLKLKVSVFGVDQEQDQDVVLAVYNGKYIGEAAE